MCADLFRHTSMAALTAVSAPRLKSVPGTLLLMVAGTTHMGMQSSSKWPLASYSCCTPSYAFEINTWIVSLKPLINNIQWFKENKRLKYLKSSNYKQSCDAELANVLNNFLHEIIRKGSEKDTTWKKVLKLLWDI